MTTHSPRRNVPVAIKKDPSLIQAFQEEVNHLFHNFFGETLPYWRGPTEALTSLNVCPATDVSETDKEVRITAEVPGLEAKDLSVSVNDRYVTINGKKEEEIKEERKGYFHQERSYGEFQRVIPLPFDLANAEKAQASMSNGVLTIIVPKNESAHSKTRQIEIKQSK